MILRAVAVVFSLLAAGLTGFGLGVWISGDRWVRLPDPADEAGADG